MSTLEGDPAKTQANRDMERMLIQNGSIGEMESLLDVEATLNKTTDGVSHKQRNQSSLHNQSFDACVGGNSLIHKLALQRPGQQNKLKQLKPYSNDIIRIYHNRSVYQINHPGYGKLYFCFFVIWVDVNKLRTKSPKRALPLSKSFLTHNANIASVILPELVHKQRYIPSILNNSKAKAKVPAYNYLTYLK